MRRLETRSSPHVGQVQSPGMEHEFRRESYGPGTTSFALPQAQSARAYPEVSGGSVSGSLATLAAASFTAGAQGPSGSRAGGENQGQHPPVQLPLAPDAATSRFAPTRTGWSRSGTEGRLRSQHFLPRTQYVSLHREHLVRPPAQSAGLPGVPETYQTTGQMEGGPPQLQGLWQAQEYHPMHEQERDRRYQDPSEGQADERRDEPATQAPEQNPRQTGHGATHSDGSPR
jgi:hypothetical protein